MNSIGLILLFVLVALASSIRVNGIKDDVKRSWDNFSKTTYEVDPKYRPGYVPPVSYAEKLQNFLARKQAEREAAAASSLNADKVRAERENRAKDGYFSILSDKNRYRL